MRAKISFSSFCLVFIILLFLNYTSVISQVKLDVKSKLGEKAFATASKNGAIAFFKASNWAEVVEVGEDYSLWLKSYKRTIKENKITITLTVELRTPAFFTDGKFVSSQNIKVEYVFDDKLYDDLKSNSPGASTFLLDAMEQGDPQMFVEAMLVGKEVEKVSYKLVNNAR